LTENETKLLRACRHSLKFVAELPAFTSTSIENAGSLYDILNDALNAYPSKEVILVPVKDVMQWQHIEGTVEGDIIEIARTKSKMADQPHEVSVKVVGENFEVTFEAVT
jgi:hypothetical protein